MPHITVMGWNIENYGASKWKKSNGGDELVAVIAEVIKKNNIDVAGFCEIRSKLGDDIGKALVQILGAANWTHQPSDAFGKKRWEQYLFVWNKTKVTSYQAFLSDFTNPNPPPAKLGFPRQSQLDRPPYVGYFQTVAAPPKKVAVAIMHSPSPSSKKGPRDAARNLAEAAALRTGDGCVLLGDFNVKAPVDVNQAGPGKEAFQNLVTAGFAQMLDADVLSSLISKKQAWVGMYTDDCKSAPYDQLFCWKATAAGITFQNDGVEDLLSEIVAATANVNTPSTQGSYLEPFLAAIDAKNSVAAVTNYNTVEDAFIAYRVFVSDHLPVVVEVHH